MNLEPTGPDGDGDPHRPGRIATSSMGPTSPARRPFVPGVVIGALGLGWGGRAIATRLRMRVVDVPRSVPAADSFTTSFPTGFARVALAGMAILLLSLRRGGRRSPSTEPRG